MTELNYPLPEIEQESVVADPRTLAALTDIKTWAGGEVDSTNLKPEGVKGTSVEKETISEAKLDAVTKALLNVKTSGFTVAATSSSLEGTSGKLYSFLGSSSLELKLPKPVANATVGAFNFLNAASNFVTVSSVANGGSIFGTFGAKTTVVLTLHQALTLVGDGTNWMMTSGEVKPETVWTTGESTGLTPSTSRPAEVAIHSQASLGTGEFKLTMSVGGVAVASAKLLQDSTVHVGANLGPYRVPPGLAWAATGTNNETVFYSQLIL